MPEYVVRRLMMAMNQRGMALKGKRVLVLGLSYKPNSSDARESPAVVVAERLVSLGAEVCAADPYVEDEITGVARVEFSEQELKKADAVILLTAHDCFDNAAVVSAGTYVLDTRGRLEGPNVEHL